MTTENNHKTITPLYYDTYTNYLLSKNLCQILKQFNFKKIDKDALFLLTNITKAYIEQIAVQSKNYTELSGRLEGNLIDLSYSLLKNNITHNNIIEYVRTSNIMNVPNMHIQKQLTSEEQKRFLLLKRLNSANIESTSAVEKNLLLSIPKGLRYFPRDFALKKSENIIDLSESIQKKKKDIKSIEKKSIEDIISSNSYYDMSKKHSRKNKNVDIISYFTEIAKFNNEDKESNRFGKRFKMKDSEIKNPNPIQNVNVPVNTDNIDKQIYEDKNNFDDEFK